MNEVEQRRMYRIVVSVMMAACIASGVAQLLGWVRF
jgi:hypothetical protein